MVLVVQLFCLLRTTICSKNTIQNAALPTEHGASAFARIARTGKDLLGPQSSPREHPSH